MGLKVPHALLPPTVLPLLLFHHLPCDGPHRPQRCTPLARSATSRSTLGPPLSPRRTVPQRAGLRANVSSQSACVLAPRERALRAPRSLSSHSASFLTTRLLFPASVFAPSPFSLRNGVSARARTLTVGFVSEPTVLGKRLRGRVRGQ